MEPKIFTSLIFILGCMQGFFCQERLDQSAAEVRSPGERVKLSCTISGFDMTDYVMHWVRQKAGGPLEWIGVVYSGTSLDPDLADSLKGQFTLTEDVGSSTQYLEAVSLKTNDTAVYYCARDREGFHMESFDLWGKGTQVTVTGEKKGPADLFPLLPCGTKEGFVHLGCMASDFSPAASLTFSWKDSISQPLQDYMRYPLVERDGVNMGVSLIRVRAEDWEKKKSYQCTVTHPALSGDRTVILEKPVPSSVPTNKPCLDLTLKSPSVIELFNNKKTVLDCIISGRDKEAVEQAVVIWKVDDIVTTVNVKTASGARGLKGRFVRNSTLTLNETPSKGKKVECQVQQKGGSPMSETLTIGQKRQSPPTVSIAIPADLNERTEFMLACLVTDFSPSEIYVAWQVDEGGYEAGITSEPVATGDKFSVTSLFKVSNENWKKGTTYSCNARHGSQDLQEVPAMKRVNKKTEEPRSPTPEPGHCDTCNCSEGVPQEDEHNTLWNTAFSFIILFLTSLTILGFSVYHTHLKVI